MEKKNCDKKILINFLKIYFSPNFLSITHKEKLGFDELFFLVGRLTFKNSVRSSVKILLVTPIILSKACSLDLKGAVALRVISLDTFLKSKIEL